MAGGGLPDPSGSVDVPPEFREAINEQTRRRASGHGAAGWSGSVDRKCTVCCSQIGVGAPCVGCLDCAGTIHIGCWGISRRRVLQSGQRFVTKPGNMRCGLCKAPERREEEFPRLFMPALTTEEAACAARTAQATALHTEPLTNAQRTAACAVR